MQQALLPNRLLQTSLGGLNHALEYATPPGCLLRIKLPLNTELREVLLCLRALQNLPDELGCRLEGLAIVGYQSGRHASPSSKAPKAPDKGVSSHVCDQIKMHSPRSTASVQTQPCLRGSWGFSCPHVKGAGKVDACALERSRSLDTVVR